MSGFLSDLVRRQEKPVDAVRPRLPSLFETDAGPALPQAKSDAPISELTVEEIAPPADEPVRARQPAQSAQQMPAAPVAESDTTQPAFAPPRQRAPSLQPPQPLEQNVERDTQPAAMQPRRAPRIADEPDKAPIAAEAPAFAIQPVAERRLTRLSPIVEETEIVEAPRVTTTRTVIEPAATQEHATAPVIRPAPQPPVFEPPQAAAPPFAPPPQTRQQAREAQRRQNEQPHVAAEPSIHVTIGRIEIRASEEREPRARAKDAPSAVMTLDEYLKSRAKR